MAGIGFRLQRLLSGKSYTDLVRAYLYSSFIATGPMLVVMFALSMIKWATQIRLSINDGEIFMSMIVYVYAFSIVGTGPFLYVVTRYLADRLYSKQFETLTPTYISVLLTVCVLQAIVAIGFLTFLPLALISKWLLFCLYLMVNGIWIAMIFLSAARNYMWIVAAFVAGGIVSILAAFVFGLWQGLQGFIAGYTIGQSIIFSILTFRIFKEFGYSRAYDFGFALYFRKHVYLVLVGFFYYLGIWIDKFIFWFSKTGDMIFPTVRICTLYDTPIFLAFLTIVPSMAFFLVQMETSFEGYYKDYYDHVAIRSSLQVIRDKKRRMIDNLTTNFVKFLFFQGVLSGIVIVFLYQIADFFYLNTLQMGVFRVGILGAFFQMGFMILMNLLFYFDCQKDAAIGCMVFCVSNGLLTYGSLQIGLPAYGFGFTAACFISLLVAYYFLNARLKYLNYWTFMKQPIIIPKFKLDTD